MADNESRLNQIREDYKYFLNYWREPRQEAETDLRFVSGDPWDSITREARTALSRPVVCPDELSQYLNQAVNNLRQNKRAIKVNPKGSGATDKNAERRAAIIRGIEYKSNAQAAYTTAFESQINCSYGAFRITTEYIGDGDEVEPRIKRIPNALTVLFDPDCKEADRSDQRKCFVTDTIRVSDFARLYPKARKTSFTAEDMNAAPEWFQGENLVTAEYWTREPIEGKRNRWKVTQEITNGVEILETNEWAGSWIPIIGVFGKEIYVNKKLVMQSLVRLARDPQLMLAYIASQEQEEFGMTPRAPIMGYTGQFETDKTAWENLNKEPRAFIQVDPTIDAVPGQLLPPPQRVPFTPNAQAYEIARESWRRAIQASMGIMPLPTVAQRQNEKSGIALQRIQTQQAVGSFHFTDNFDRALENCGRQLNELITRVMDTPRHVESRGKDDEHALAFVTSKKYQDQVPQDVDPENVLITDEGDYGVTISTGPNFQSQREEASQFVDLLVSNLAQLPPPGSPPAKILALGIKLKNVGPIGDELADLLDPQDQEIPPQAQAAIAQAQAQVQALMGELQKLQMEKQAKVVEKEYQLQSEHLRSETQIAVAEINTKSQQLNERMTFVSDLIQKLIDMEHAKELAANQQAHEADMATQQQASDAAQATQAQAAQQEQSQV